MKKKILPIGKQSYRKLREDNCIYVDKTQHIYNLCTLGSMYFLSRPRRFGKSLLLSTMAELFRGSRELFDDTWILDKWDWTKRNPVLHISFLEIPYETYGLEEGIRMYLMELYKTNKVRPSKNRDIKTLFTQLIKKIYDKQGQVVILIDRRAHV